ncbi:hypothetical protein DL93DRAFT_2234074 [Clavulina sp. PMI_390]|nr:hypothetical protein DL93DRAFT_2234074 [Clavulina sp. PMI_390]
MSTCDDFTALLPTSSVVILVEGTLFQIPRSLLTHHSPEFGEALGSLLESDEPHLAIHVEASAEVFHEFYAMLFTPLQSCLRDDYPLSKDLRKLLNLSAFLHRYKFTELKQQVLKHVDHLALQGALPSSLSDGFSALDVFQAGHTIQHPKLVEAALDVLLHQLAPPKQDPQKFDPDSDPDAFAVVRQKNIPSPYESSESFVSPYHILPIAEQFGSEKLLNAAYYNILLQRQDSWEASQLGEARLRILYHAIRHASMESRTMSLSLRIQDVTFLMPACLIEHHGGLFRDMLDHSIGGDRIELPLQDPLSAFQDLRSILFSPITSCLFCPNLIKKNLKRALELLEVLHKYRFQEYEDYVFQLIRAIEHPELLEIQLSDSCTVFDVFHFGDIIDRALLKQSSRSVMLQRLWKRHPSLSPYHVLRFGKELKDDDLIGAAYYQIVLRGGPAWREADPGVTELACRRLLETRLKLTEQWQDLFNAVGKAGDDEKVPFYHSCCWSNSGGCCSSPISTRFQDLHRDLAFSNTPYYDFIGKVRVLISVAKKHCGQCSSRYDSELASMKERLHLYHHSEED